ncbi:MAG TPA: TonB-dependent receptor [Chitinophagales bacterium]|nr:TonB-dependent receptor [Chitinophagales bacterium]
MFLIPAEMIAQEKFTISGYIRDKDNGETLFGANIYEKETLRGATSNEYGFYSLTLPAGTCSLVVSYIGYTSFDTVIALNSDVRLHVALRSEAKVTEEVVVTSERKDKNVYTTQMSTVELPVEKIKSLPVLLGEVDILKTIQLLPGVQTSGEGNSSFYVRGGGPDQNLILLDEAVVYNPGHLFGFFSVFNSDALKNTTLIKGGIPAEYGGRLSSVLDISMKDGNNKQYQLEGGIGLISSRFTAQGPIRKDISSFMISARRTYIDLLLLPILPRVAEGEFDGNSYYFYDLNTKINYKFNDKNRLYLSGYFGRDVFKFNSPDDDFAVKIPWGNATATLRWNHLFNDKLFMNTSVIFNDFKFRFESSFSDLSFQLFSGIRDFNVKSDVDYFTGFKYLMKFGGSYTYHVFTPYTANAQTGDASFSNDSLNKKYAHELALYAQDEFDITEKLRVNAGVRGSVFMQVGPYIQYYYDSFGDITDTVSYGRSKLIKAYWGIEPRASLRYSINPDISLKASITLGNQYIHLVSNATTTLPTDLWVPSSLIVKPQIGILYALGYFHNFRQNEYEASVEVYYKDLRNQIEFGQSYVPELSIDVENSFVFGKGWSYGAEFFLNKREGNFTGWVGYTLSFTSKKFPDLNNGNTFPARYDRRHDAVVVLSYEINKRWKLSSTYVYGTGQALTLPNGRYFIEGRIVNEYTERNGYRMSPYHRLDVAAVLTLRKRERFRHELVFSVYNIYNRKNPFFIYFDTEGNIQDGNVEVQAKQVSLFPVLPSITWNFKWEK